jgi:hypothetical protein
MAAAKSADLRAVSITHGDGTGFVWYQKAINYIYSQDVSVQRREVPYSGSVAGGETGIG